jgi:peptidoglycan/LPS O-acetylase OafA/YrhL
MDVVLLLACLAVMCGASALSYLLIDRWQRRPR